MKYMGSKVRYAKHLLPIILENRKEGQYFIDLFAGGMNLVDKVTGPRIGNDINEYLICMWDSLVYGKWIPPAYSKEQYVEIRENKDAFDKKEVGWVGFNCSYSGKWFGGYAGVVNTKQGVRDYQQEARNNTFKQIPNLVGVEFTAKSYHEFSTKNCIIYCDIPYEGTTTYKDPFNHKSFWKWARQASQDNVVYVSEYNAPEDFECVWQMETKSSLSANGKSGGSKSSVEKLFTYKG